MKKFNSWLNESKIEEKNIIKEDIGLNVPSSVANVSRLGLGKNPYNKFKRSIEDLKEKHVKDAKSTTSSASYNRSMLLNSISLLNYDDVNDFMKDWNYVKNHIIDKEEVIMDNPANLDNSDEYNLNVDRK